MQVNNLIPAAIVALGLISAPASAEPAAPAGTYTLDPGHTQIIFAIKHMGISTFYGRFGKVAGTLNFDPAKPQAGALNVQIDMTAIDTHVAELDSTLPNSVFQADKFPTATFVATKIVKTGKTSGTVTGDLTLAGTTKPVTLKVIFNGGRTMAGRPPRVGFDATASIKRSDFGLDKMMWSAFVGDDVQLMIEAEAAQK
jgi:polyisoprenoid-binding protein YceI